MKKDEYIELVQKKLSGGSFTSDQKTKYHPQIVDRHIRMAYNQLLFELSVVCFRKNDFSPLNSLTKAFVASVTKDEVRGVKVVQMPFSLLQTIENNTVRYVGPIKDESMAYIYRDNQASELYDNVEAGSVEDRPRWSLEFSKIILRPIDEVPEQILVKAVVPWEGFERLDEVNIPGGQDEKLFELVQRSIIAAPQDLENNNVAQ